MTCRSNASIVPKRVITLCRSFAPGWIAALNAESLLIVSIDAFTNADPARCNSAIE